MYSHAGVLEACLEESHCALGDSDPSDQCQKTNGYMESDGTLFSRFCTYFYLFSYPFRILRSQNGPRMPSGPPRAPTCNFKVILVAFGGPFWRCFRINFELVFRAVFGTAPGASPRRLQSILGGFWYPFWEPFWRLLGNVGPHAYISQKHTICYTLTTFSLTPKTTKTIYFGSRCCDCIRI